MKLIGDIYPKDWWGLLKLYSMSHSVRFRLNSGMSGVKLPSWMNSSSSVRLKRSFVALSFGV